MRRLNKLFGDFSGLIRVCGFALAIKWLCGVLLNLPEVIRSGNLQVADRFMGTGPFHVRHCDAAKTFLIAGLEAFSGIREMYVRDTYLHGGILAIADGDVVLDLGANMGNFTNLALAHGPSVRVIAVEPNASLNRIFEKSVGLNPGFQERVQLVNAFVGLLSSTQVSMLEQSDSAEADWLTEDALIEIAGLSRLDFLKCDIEGGEFGLLTRNSKLLAMAKSVAIEIHHFAGDVDGFVAMLRESGFSTLNIQRDPDGTATVLAKRGKDLSGFYE